MPVDALPSPGLLRSGTTPAGPGTEATVETHTASGEHGLGQGREAQDARFRAREGVMACPFGEGLALLDARSNTYFSLDAVGTVVWRALGGHVPGGEVPNVAPATPTPAIPTPATLKLLCDAVANEFEVTAEACGSDIATLVTDLEAHGLCVREPRS